jgi:methionine synthase II (cobalamin-independent)
VSEIVSVTGCVGHPIFRGTEAGAFKLNCFRCLNQGVQTNLSPYCVPPNYVRRNSQCGCRLRGAFARLFQLNVGGFYLQMASEPDRKRALGIVKQLPRPNHTVFVGVIDPIDPKVETAGEVRDRVLEAASILPPAQLGTTDDCGFAPFADDTSTAREIAFSKIRARVEGTEMAARVLC